MVRHRRRRGRPRGLLPSPLKSPDPLYRPLCNHWPQNHKSPIPSGLWRRGSPISTEIPRLHPKVAFPNRRQEPRMLAVVKTLAEDCAFSRCLPFATAKGGLPQDGASAYVYIPAARSRGESCRRPPCAHQRALQQGTGPRVAASQVCTAIRSSPATNLESRLTAPVPRRCPPPNAPAIIHRPCPHPTPLPPAQRPYPQNSSSQDTSRQPPSSHEPSRHHSTPSPFATPPPTPAENHQARPAQPPLSSPSTRTPTFSTISTAQQFFPSTPPGQRTSDKR